MMTRLTHVLKYHRQADNRQSLRDLVVTAAGTAADWVGVARPRAGGPRPMCKQRPVVI